MKIKQLNKPGHFTAWNKQRIEELQCLYIANEVGQMLLFENNNIRLWQLCLDPGQRFQFHRHTHPYSWTALTVGKAISHYDSGEIVEISYQVGDLYFYDHGVKGGFIHDLENVGDSSLIFSTVEYINDMS